jgi:hypothetical protein
MQAGDRLHRGLEPFGQKYVCAKDDFTPKQTLLLVRPSLANVNSIKANYGEMSTEKYMAFGTRHEDDD